ncbi:MAG: hypothetical protein WCJ22_05470, partial [Actinomycetes bacterium]
MENEITYPSSPVDRVLAELADAYGVATEYVSATGETRFVSQEVILKVLLALDVNVADAAGGVDVDKCASALAARQLSAWRQTIPPVYVTRIERSGDGDRDMWVHVPRGFAVTVQVRLEDDTVVGPLPELGGDGEFDLDGTTIIEFWVRLPQQLPLGWHTIEVLDSA